MTTSRSDSGPAVINVAQEREPHLRFEIEDVEESRLASHQNTLTAENTGDFSISSLGYNTTEAVPMTVYYRKEGEGNSRPTLEDLRQGKKGMPRRDEAGEEFVDGGRAGGGNGDEADEGADPAPVAVKKWQFWKKSSKGPKKFGWIKGVLIRCLLNIWGVMLFIRLTWVVGQAGIGLAAVIIALSGVVTIITTLSMSAICTNGEVRGGGAYYLISRSLGPQFGGAIGIIFSLANAVAVALYVVGFAETVADLLLEHTGISFTGSRINDIRVVGFILVTLLLLVALVGLDFEAYIQMVLLFILLVAILDVIVGSFIPRPAGSQDVNRGFTGYSWPTIRDNFAPKFSATEGNAPETFFTVFAVFFPAATGILAGANISGNLKNPQTAIPKGTLLAILITSITYLLMAIMGGMIVLRDAPGNPEAFLRSFGVCMSEGENSTSSSFLIDPGNATQDCGVQYSVKESFPACSNFSASSCYPSSCLYEESQPRNLMALCNSSFLALVPALADNSNRRCSFGLLNNFQVMEMISAFGPIVTAGIFAATISSALTSLISAPKVFQSVCNDKVFPVIAFFGKGGWKGTGTEPIRGYFLTYVISLACIAIGSLNEIATIISMFFLMAYALINYSCFAASFVKTPGWRPAFKLYNLWVALFGAAICVVIMFVIRWYYALVTIVVVAILYKLVDFLKPDINWGSSTQAFLYSYAIKNLLKLEKLEDHVKNFRPQFLVLSGPPSSRPDLVHFISHMSKEVGVMICGQVFLGEYDSNRQELVVHSAQQKKWLRKEKLKGFHNIVLARSLREGCQHLFQLSGLGKLKPNTVVVGFKSNWTKCSAQEVAEYVAVLHDAFDMKFGVMIFRLRAGFDATDQSTPKDADVKIDPRAADFPASLRPRGSVSTGAIVPSSSAAHRTSDQPLLAPEVSIKLSNVPLSSSSSHSLNRSPSNPLSSVFAAKSSYQPISSSSNQDSSSLDSYSLAMEGTGRVELEDLDEQEDRQEDVAAVVDPLPELITMPSRFESVQKKGNIDVWWLYDDGGLAILLPFLLSRHKHWNHCKLRIFTAGSTRNIDQAKLRMVSLLRKFRINFSVVIEVQGVYSKPSPESIDQYRSIVAAAASGEVDRKDLDKHTLRHIRLGELLHEHSSDARLIVITMTVPQRSASACEIMGGLDVMSRDLPPTLIMRGNQSSVLTFYS